jgi:hypothetical protein
MCKLWTDRRYFPDPSLVPSHFALRFDSSLEPCRNAHRPNRLPRVAVVSLSLYEYFGDWGLPECHGVGRDINVQCVLIKEMIIIVDHYTLAVRNRR